MEPPIQGQDDSIGVKLHNFPKCNLFIQKHFVSRYHAQVRIFTRFGDNTIAACFSSSAAVQFPVSPWAHRNIGNQSQTRCSRPHPFTDYGSAVSTQRSSESFSASTMSRHGELSSSSRIVSTLIR